MPLADAMFKMTPLDLKKKNRQSIKFTNVISNKTLRLLFHLCARLFHQPPRVDGWHVLVPHLTQSNTFHCAFSCKIVADVPLIT